MARYYGKIGYAIPEETTPGVYTEKIIERPYKGSIIRNTRKWETGEGLNDNINIDNTVSIVADAYAYGNLSFIRYVTYLGAKWKVKSIEVDHPRINLSIGGVYNEQSTRIP